MNPVARGSSPRGLYARRGQSGRSGGSGGQGAGSARGNEVSPPLPILPVQTHAGGAQNVTPFPRIASRAIAQLTAGRRRLRVKGCPRRLHDSFLLSPRKRTMRGQEGKSATGQQATLKAWLGPTEPPSQRLAVVPASRASTSAYRNGLVIRSRTTRRERANQIRQPADRCR